MDDNHLAQLPEELLQETLNYLDNGTLASLARSSKWAYETAIPLLWKDVELVDCRTTHPDMPYHSDEHDDTPIIRKLIVLASNDWIASHVQSLTHRCHLPPPALFAELPQTSFQSRFLSHDPRTLLLLDRACANLSSLQTLRIIFGHWNITKGLLNGILDNSRKRSKPLRKLWLENCALGGVSLRVLNGLDLQGLESVRFRRLQLVGDTGRVFKQQVYTRGRSTQFMQDGQGLGYATTTDQWSRQEIAFSNVIESWGSRSYPLAMDDWAKLFEDAHIYDDIIYDQILETADDDLRKRYNNDVWDHKSRMKCHAQGFIRDNGSNDNDPSPAILRILKGSASTLTSLNLDWVIIRKVYDMIPLADANRSMAIFKEIFSLRFPCLRAFQLRNAVVRETQLPSGLYLLDQCTMAPNVSSNLCIDFMEAHSNIRCLAWPMDMFLDSSRTERAEKVTKIIERLAHSLVELRVDAMYDANGEFQSDNSAIGVANIKSRDDRRAFISEFASKMQKVEDLKIEGGIPRDERRETLRAMGASPLRKVVLIGVNSPAGNTWGLHGADIESHGINEDLSDPEDLETLEFEDPVGIVRLGAAEPTPQPQDQMFRAEYGWPSSAPLIHTLAAYHADTITELKFCGYRGAPIMWEPTQITYPMYSPLRHFHNLKSLVLSLWLQTMWEEDFQDEQIIQYWLNTRSPSSTALVMASNNHELTGWAKQLAERFRPLCIATRMKDMIGPFLSERAKAQKGGVHVRGSFCVGLYGGIFDFDVSIVKAPNGEDAILDWVGPREELHPDRRREKLQRRRWF